MKVSSLLPLTLQRVVVLYFAHELDNKCVWWNLGIRISIIHIRLRKG